jgi:hypothetical protein
MLKSVYRKRQLSFETLQNRQLMAIDLVSAVVPGLESRSAEGYHEPPAVSADGRYFLFSSNSKTLVDQDVTPGASVYLRDTQLGTTQIICEAKYDPQFLFTYSSWALDISADGNILLFASERNDLIANDTNSACDLFTKNMSTGVITRVSTGVGGIQLASGALTGSLSDNGRFVAFSSSSVVTNPNQFNSLYDVYIKDIQTGKITLASKTTSGAPSNGNSDEPIISGDGSSVVFYSNASNLSPNVNTPVFYTYVFSTKTNQLTSILPYVNNTFDDAPYSLSYDGRYLALNSNDQITRHDMNSGETVDFGDFDISPNDYCFSPQISANGQSLTFLSNANNLATTDSDSTADLYSFDFLSGTLKHLTAFIPIENKFETAWGKTIDNSSKMIFQTQSTQLVEYDFNDSLDTFIRDENTTTLVTKASSQNRNVAASFSQRATASSDGRYIAFQSLARNLTSNDNNNFQDIFVTDWNSGTTTLISTSSTGTLANNFSSNPIISGNGKFVVFRSNSTNLVAGDDDLAVDLFRKNLLTGETLLISRNSQGAQLNASSFPLAISDDGNYVLFGSQATNTGTNNTLGFQIYRKNITTGELVLAGSDSSGNPVAVDIYSDSPNEHMSGNGEWFVFASEQSNLDLHDTNNCADIFLKNMNSGTLQRINVLTDGTEANNQSTQPVISKDGSHVAFITKATNLVGFPPNALTIIVLLDLNTGNMTAIVPPESGFVQQVNIDADGSHVVYSIFNSVYLWNKSTGTSELISVNDAGDSSNDFAENLSISADGKAILFNSYANNLYPNSYSEAVFIYHDGKRPIASADMANGKENTTFNIPLTANDTDPDSSTATMTAVVVTAPPATVGTVSISNGTVAAFTPTTGFKGITSFTYKVRDAEGNYSSPAKVEVSVRSSNHCNPWRPLDADKNININSIDALVIINDLIRNGARFLGNEPVGSFYLDTDDNNFVNAIDVLVVINYLNNLTNGEGELKPAEAIFNDLALSQETMWSSFDYLYLSNTTDWLEDVKRKRS